MTVETKTLKEMALTRFENFDSWLREASTIFNNSKVEVWIKNEGGWCTMQAMKDHKRLTGRKYSKCLVIGYYSPSDKTWVISEHLNDNYPAWTQETKRLWGMV